MITLRLIDNLESLYHEFSRWWTTHGFAVISKRLLDTMGLVAEDDGKPVAACWVYTASTGSLAMLEWMVVNPDVSPRLKKESVEHLLEFAAEECARRGYPVLFTVCHQRSLVRLYRRHGFSVSESGGVSMMRTLQPVS